MEIRNENLLIILLRCLEAEQNDGIDEGSYFGESDRKVIDGLVHDGLIMAQNVPGKLHWRSFKGFTPKGRDVFLDCKGEIRLEYFVNQKKIGG